MLFSTSEERKTHGPLAQRHPLQEQGLKRERWPPARHAVIFRCLPARCPACPGAAAACRDSEFLIFVCLSHAEGPSDASG